MNPKAPLPAKKRESNFLDDVLFVLVYHIARYMELNIPSQQEAQLEAKNVKRGINFFHGMPRILRGSNITL